MQKKKAKLAFHLECFHNGIILIEYLIEDLLHALYVCWLVDGRGETIAFSFYMFVFSCYNA